jgi:hypothetical protein
LALETADNRGAADAQVFATICWAQAKSRQKMMAELTFKVENHAGQQTCWTT